MFSSTKDKISLISKLLSVETPSASFASIYASVYPYFSDI